MLTTDDFLNLEDYAFKSSPESCSGNSCFTDCTDLPSDEDFLQQLSSDLDIPLFLNPGEDELSLLNSFFDKTPDEIMSEIAFPASPKLDICSDVKIEESSYSSSSSNKSNSPIQSPEDSIQFFEIKDEMKIEPHSPVMHMPVCGREVDSKTAVSNVKGTPKANSFTAKRVPIQPKIVTSTPNNKVVILKNADYKRPSPNVVTSPPAKVVVLENIATVPITNVAPIPQATMTNSIINNNISPVVLQRNDNLSLNINNIDPKILKRHQRKIKNRESACLSRKKKKDYLTSLENQVKELTTENQQLKLENQQLKSRLMKYEGNQTTNSPRNFKTNIVLCMFLFSVVFHLDYIRNPFSSRSQADLLQKDAPKVVEHHGRNLLWTPEEVVEKNTSNFSPLTMCPAAINQTESARLVLELERWIGKPKGMMAGTPTAQNTTRLSVQSFNRSSRKRKLRRYATPPVSSFYGGHSVGHKLSSGGNKELQVFSPSPEQLYGEFFEAINRQDDTFYVVSLSDHHLLLPALHHNKTRRPKMSLIMPSVLRNENITQPNIVPLMQIDCEVLDTRLIQIRYGSIPKHLRKNGNTTLYQENENVSKPDESASNYTTRKAYKPYFIKQKSVRNNEDPIFYNLR